MQANLRFIFVFAIIQLLSFPMDAEPTNSGDDNTSKPYTMIGVERGDCQVAGYWINELRSLMILRQDPNGSLAGEYGTIVESKPGAKGPKMSTLKGEVHEDLVTFHVFYKGQDNMRSQASWNGQCYKDCEPGKTTLRTTWVLVSQKGSCKDAWGQNRVGQNVFTKIPDADVEEWCEENGISPQMPPSKEAKL